MILNLINLTNLLLMQNTFIGIIPARYGSTRFPGKPLAMLGGMPVIERVYRQVSSVMDNVAVATDDQRIMDAVTAFGGRAIMTSSHHRSGTDRVFEAYTILAGEQGNATTRADEPVIINIQGDEPFIQPSQLQTLMACFDDEATDIATLVKPYSPADGLEALTNPNAAKVVTDNAGNALYFSRSVVPYLRGVPQEEWLQRHTYLKHIGLYAYRAHVLAAITSMPPSPLEIAESLEQLRWLQAGLCIRTAQTDTATIGIDTPEDLQRAEEFLRHANTTTNK